MSKVDIKRLDSVTKNDTTATEQINDNFQALQAAIENTVSRDGTVPNYMDADLDLNSYRIINAGAPVEGKDVVTLEYFEEKAGGAIEAAAEAKASASKAASSAQSALIASNNAIGQLAQAEGLLTAAEGQLEETQQYVDAAKADIDATVETGKQDINTTIDEASMRLSDTIEQAVEDVKTEAVAAAEGAIQDAAATATAIVVDYANNEIKPVLNEIASNAEADAANAAESAELATNEADEAKHWAEDSRVWATGEDAEVEEIAPGEEEHSSRGYADLAMAIANTPEDVPVDTSKLLALQIIKGPKGDSSIGTFTGDNTIEGTLNVKSDSNRPLKVTGLAGTSASGFQIVDSNGAGESDFEHYATGDRYGTRITNHNNISDTSVSVDLYQTNVGKSVLDATAVDTVLVKDLQVDGADVVKTSGDQTIDGHKTFTTRLITTQNGVHQVYNTDGATLSSYILDNARAYRADGVTPWFFVGAQKQRGAYYQRMGIWNDANTDFAAINVGFDSNGNKFTYAPTPVATSNTTEIATTAWVNSRGISLKYASGVAVTMADGGTYTAPSRGVLILFLDTKENDNWSYVYCNGYKVGMAHGKSSRSNGDATVFIPVAAGDKITRDSNFNKVEGHFYPYGV